jgi:hypothetical protein
MATGFLRFAGKNCGFNQSDRWPLEYKFHALMLNKFFWRIQAIAPLVDYPEKTE